MMDASLEDPLSELDLNDSDSILRTSTKKSKINGLYDVPLKSQSRSRLGWEMKENDSDKLPVYHRGPYGEQLGTLIPRHYVQSNSKCIQCRNCGIFFTTSSFLQHCHDQYGKRVQCNGVQLHLGLESPSQRQLQAWAEFQKKMHSGDSTFHSVNATMLSKPNRSSACRRQDRFERQNERVGDGQPALWNATTTAERRRSPPRDASNLGISRKFPSLSVLHTTDSLSLSELGEARAGSTLPIDGDQKYVPRLLRGYAEATPSQHRFTPRTGLSAYTRPQSCEPHRRHDVTGSFPNYDGPIKRPPVESTYALEDRERIFSNINTTRAALSVSAGDVQRNTSPNRSQSASQEPKDLIVQACLLLQQAKKLLADDGTQGTSAWRKMYEEERDHRMTLEAKLRDLERELRLKRV